jgi:ribosomal protein L40E
VRLRLPITSLVDSPLTVFTGTPAAVAGVFLYLMLNWCYTTAVFTNPGSTTNEHGYSTLPTNGSVPTSFTVKSNGELRFCKKCQARKPDRAHHCSTCRRCVLKMDHHCPWLATCVGLYNHKAFLLFLIYTTLFSLYCLAASGSWVWAELLSNEAGYVENLMPVNYIMLCIIAAIIGLVIGIFTGWHLYLATRGQTTIECLEKTRYLSPLRRTMHQAYINQHTPGQGISLPSYGQQLLEIHQNALPGITRPEEGEELRREPPTRARRPDDLEDQTSSVLAIRDSARGPQLQAGSRRFTYDEMERERARKRYEEYLDEQDSSKLPNAFDLGPKRNLLHLFGHNPWLWLLPICNTTGDGWTWEPNPKWLDAREKLARERWEQAERERNAGWGPTADDNDEPVTWQTEDLRSAGAGRHYLQPPSRPSSTNSGRKTPSKADRVLGRDPNLYADVELSPAARAHMKQRAAELAALQERRKKASPIGKELHEYELDVIDRFDDDYEDDDDEVNGKGAAAQKSQPQQQNATERRSSPLSLGPTSRWARPAGSGLPSPRGLGVGVGLGRTSAPVSPVSQTPTVTVNGNHSGSADDEVD